MRSIFIASSGDKNIALVKVSMRKYYCSVIREAFQLFEIAPWVPFGMTTA
jgi:hypothetical protein